MSLLRDSVWSNRHVYRPYFEGGEPRVSPPRYACRQAHCSPYPLVSRKSEGDYRIIYEIIRKEKAIVIHSIGHRREIYQKKK